MPRSDYPGAATVARMHTEAERMADLCTACGHCLTACPMTRYAPEAAVDPQATVRGVLDLLRGGPSTPAALAWVAACTRSGLCTAACGEEAIDPAIMMKLARMRAMGALGEPPKITVKEDAQFAPRVKAFARLTMTDGEQDQWL